MNINEIIDKIKLAIDLCGDGGNDPFTKEERDEIGKWLEVQRPKEYGHNIWHAGTKQEWKVGDILAYYECSTDHEGEYFIGKITKVYYEPYYEDWFYEFDDGCGATEESLSADECYTISEEYYNKHYNKHK